VPLLLFFVFVVFPAVELFVVVETAHAIGLGWTLLALVAGAFLGAYVMRRAGSSWWRALRGQVTANDGAVVTSQRPDGRAAAKAALLFLAGLLIFLPGFVSDVVGLLLLLPPVRGLLQAGTARWFTRRFTEVSGPGGVRVWTRSTGPAPGTVIRGDVVQGDVIPGEVIPGDVIPGDIVRDDEPPQIEP
jgi:UPF0716 protein FxsA